MNAQETRQFLLNEVKLKEFTVVVPEWPGTELLIKELPADESSDLMEAAQEKSMDANGKVTSTVSQKKLLGSVLVRSLRHAPSGELIFGLADQGSAMASLGTSGVMKVALMALHLNGLDEDSVNALKKSTDVMAPNASAVVDSSLSLPPNSHAPEQNSLQVSALQN